MEYIQYTYTIKLLEIKSVNICKCRSCSDPKFIKGIIKLGCKKAHAH